MVALKLRKAPGAVRRGRGSRNAVVALKPLDFARRLGIAAGSRNAVVALKLKSIVEIIPL